MADATANVVDLVQGLATYPSASVALLAFVLVVMALYTMASDSKSDAKSIRNELQRGSTGTERFRASADDISPVKEPPLEQEWWVPKLEIVDWSAAAELEGSPWDFDGCETTQDALSRVWKQPVATILQEPFASMQRQVTRIRVAKCSISWPREVHFAIVYTLQTGAEIFGGAPLESSVGLELPELGNEESSDHNLEGVTEGLRQRRRNLPHQPRATSKSEAPELGLPCLAPFYRVHDGIGVLLSTKHLPLLLEEPLHTVQGSCFYVYPSRMLKEHGGRRGLVKFARVDSKCYACADSRVQEPHVVYAELNADLVDDHGEGPLEFVAATITNISGEEATTAWHFGGPPPDMN
mmetsp:Transcript_51682/g.123028  ORF Transcript_51682/g.123028 Transcript_51682/m.123028 type:complete len:352 (+) Transcript_51682:70-1125(+)